MAKPPNRICILTIYLLSITHNSSIFKCLLIVYSVAVLAKENVSLLFEMNFKLHAEKGLRMIGQNDNLDLTGKSFILQQEAAHEIAFDRADCFHFIVNPLFINDIW
ncbi:MAG: hypothetical protein ACKO5E_17690 [bacterium]